MTKYLIIIIVVLVSICGCIISEVTHVKDERDSYKANQDVLLSDVEFYRVNDSLNVAQTGVLKMNIEELKRYRAEDDKLIQKLQGDARDLARITSIQASTIANFKGTVRDSIVYVDSITTQLIKCIDVRNAWYNINGCIAGDSINGIMLSRDKLKIVERIQYKRFLGFLWKTNKIKDRRIDVISLNPHTRIEAVESIIIED